MDEKKEITETGAGEEINREINEQIRKHQKEMRELRDTMEEAMRGGDEESRDELEAEKRNMLKAIKKLQHDSERLESEYKEAKARLEALMQQKEQEAREELERVKVKYREEIERLRYSVKITALTQHQKDQKQAKIDELSQKARHARPNFFSKLAGWSGNVIAS